MDSIQWLIPDPSRWIQTGCQVMPSYPTWNVLSQVNLMNMCYHTTISENDGVYIYKYFFLNMKKISQDLFVYTGRTCPPLWIHRPSFLTKQRTQLEMFSFVANSLLTCFQDHTQFCRMVGRALLSYFVYWSIWSFRFQRQECLLPL